MISIEVITQKLEEAQKKLGLFNEGMNIKKLLQKAATDQIARIKVRTAKGEDFEGETFVPYSDTYKKIREGKGLGIDVVDLFDQGHMLAAMTYEMVGYDKVRIYFSGALEAAKAHGHHFGTSHKWGAHTVELPARPFFEMSDSDQVEISKVFEDEMERLNRKYFV